MPLCLQNSRLRLNSLFFSFLFFLLIFVISSQTFVSQVSDPYFFFKLCSYNIKSSICICFLPPVIFLIKKKKSLDNVFTRLAILIPLHYLFCLCLWRLKIFIQIYHQVFFAEALVISGVAVKHNKDFSLIYLYFKEEPCMVGEVLEWRNSISLW